MCARFDKTPCLFIVCCCLSALFMCGCKGEAPNAENGGTVEGRLEAAKQITSSTEKNAALVEVARIAAEAGHGKIVMEAISEMSLSTVRNSAAETTAPLLAKKGKTEDALAVAKMSNSSTLRNKVLAEIAMQQ